MADRSEATFDINGERRFISEDVQQQICDNGKNATKS